MIVQKSWLRVYLISYAIAWVIFYCIALKLMESGVQTALAVIALALLAASVALFIGGIRRARVIVGIGFAALVLVSLATGEYLLAVLHVGAFLPLINWLGTMKGVEDGVENTV